MKRNHLNKKLIILKKYNAVFKSKAVGGGNIKKYIYIYI